MGHYGVFGFAGLFSSVFLSAGFLSSGFFSSIFFSPALSSADFLSPDVLSSGLLSGFIFNPFGGLGGGIFLSLLVPASGQPASATSRPAEMNRERSFFTIS